jgi:hypothetical protein
MVIKIYELAVIQSKWPENIPNFSISRPSIIYPFFGLKIYHLATLERICESLISKKSDAFVSSNLSKARQLHTYASYVCIAF